MENVWKEKFADYVEGRVGGSEEINQKVLLGIFSVRAKV
jgi:hypothetical protein